MDRRNKSGVRGVNFDKKYGKWRAATKVNKKWFLIGFFNSKEEAASAFDAYARKRWGEFYQTTDLVTPAALTISTSNNLAETLTSTSSSSTTSTSSIK